MDLKQKDEKYLGRDVPATPIEVISSKGCYLYGPNKKKYIDFLMGWCVGNIGWGVKEVQEEIKKFSGPDYVIPYYLYKGWAELAEILAKNTPGKLTKTFRATGGTEAVEIALQAAMAHTERSKFISIEGSYHGHSIGTMSIGESGFRKKYKNLLPGCFKIKPPLNKNAAYKIEKLLSKKDIAAYISEPIICNLAVVIPDKEYFEIVYGACKKYGTVFIMDEVATGFGRTGKLFGSEHYNLEPDIMCLGKAITGGYGVLGATIMTEELANSMKFDFSFYSTFGWQPLNVAVALANLKHLLKRKATILKNVSEMSRYFSLRLNKMKFKYPAEIRIKGVAIGIEFKQKDYAIEIVKKCIAKGLLFSEMGRFGLTLFPALTIDRKSAKEGLDIFESCL